MTGAYTCVICNEVCEGYGNNPAPLVNEGKCCDDCNGLVIIERIRMVVE